MKNNINKKLLLLVAFAVSIVGCSDDFLEKTPTQTIAVSDLEKTGGISPEILESTLRGVYTMMYNPGTGGIGGHNDFGQKVYDIYSDMLSSDVALTRNSYSRFRAIAQLTIPVDYTQNRGNYQTWRYYYRVIRSCNLIITALGGNDAPITDDFFFFL